MTRTGRRRYICSFVKADKDGKLRPNVVVIAASSKLLARIKLCQEYEVKNVDGLPRSNKKEGIKSIREAETNKYEGETESESFYNENYNS